jgi:hypothetical protein
MSLILRALFVVFATLGYYIPHVATAETITIRNTTTTSAELPNVVAESVEHFSESPGETHKLILHGDFAPLATIKIQWWGKHRLTISGSALLDGSAMPEKSAVVFMAGRNLTLEKLRFVNSKGHAVIVGGSSDRYEIRDCVFEDCQKGALHVWNDPHTIQANKSRRGLISGNRITRFNLEKAKWANDGITVFDQRVTISGNEISNSATETNGIRAMGRDLLIQGNVVKKVSRDDAGGIYLWGGPHASLFRGNVVRWNHVVGASRGIYLDDGTSGARVEENVVEDSVVCAIFISGGRNNLVERNIIDRAPVFVHIDSRCLGWDSRPEYAGVAGKSLARLRAALATGNEAAVLRKRYPELRELTEKNLKPEVYGRPEANKVQGNYARSVKKVWETIDFSATIATDFHALNELSVPHPIAQGEELGRISLRERFSFQGWDRIKHKTP